MPPPRRRKSLASDENPDQESSETSTPPPERPSPPKKKGKVTKKPKMSEPDSSVELRPAPKASKGAPTGKRKRTGDTEEDISPRRAKATGRLDNSKRAKADSNGKTGSSRDLSRQLDSSDSDMFEFTTEAYRASAGVVPSQAVTASQPLMRKQANGRAAAPKASSQTLPSRTDVKGKKRAEPSDTSTNKSNNNATGRKDRMAMPPPAAPHGQPTTPRGKTRLDPILHAATDATRHDSTIDIGIAETPMQNRNIAMRRAADDVSSSSRRSSFERRGRRSSVVGDGFEALPHPDVDDHLLHRHINPNEMPSIRCLVLVSWAAQRQLKVLQGGEGKGRDLAIKAAEAFIASIAKHGVDLQWSSYAVDGQTSTSRRRLRKNPANTFNEHKRDKLQAWTDRMNAEQTARSEVKQRYTALQAPRQASSSLISISTAALDLLTPLPKLDTAEDIVAYGKELLERAQSDPQADQTAHVDVEQELSISFEDLRVQTAGIKQETHRIDQFVKRGSNYAHTRIAAVHRALGKATNGDASMPEPADLLRALSRAEVPPPRH